MKVQSSPIGCWGTSYIFSELRGNLYKFKLTMLKVYNPGTFIIQLCNHQLYLIPKHFCHPQRQPQTHSSHSFPIPLLPSLWQWLSLFVDSSIQDISYKKESYNMWPFVPGFFHITCFWGSPTLYHALAFHSFLRQNSISLHGYST